jgi:two-component system, LytTR family, sensor kinase
MQAINFKYDKDRFDSPDSYKMKRNTVYWISQISGWSFYFLINIVAAALTDGLTWQRALLLLFFCSLGVLLTHLYRKEVKKKDWINLPLKKFIPLVLLTSLVIGLLLYVPYFVLNYIFDVTPLERGPSVTLLMGTLSSVFIIFIWSLLYFSAHLFENYKRAEIESYIWEAAVKDYELKTLKSQLNPHFMFNAMNSIRALIEEDPESAKTALTRLSGILRYSLKMERSEMVPLEEEIQTVKDYLLLEGIRYEERLKFCFNVDPKTVKIEIPPMMIQTLVENGIKHGVSKQKAGGVVKVETLLSNSKLFIKISNTGQIDDDAIKHSQGFGVSNTRHRLNLIYGEKSSFSIFNEDLETVTAEVVIPTGGIKNESFNN